MQNMSATNLFASRTHTSALNALGEHLRQHGTGLCNLLDAIDEPSGIDALCDLHIALDEENADAASIVRALQDILRVLSDQAPSALDQLGREWNMPASDMSRWHGARVSEFLTWVNHVD